MSEDCPIDWDIISGDNLFTYIPVINESQIPIPLAPSDSNFILQQVVFPRGVSGCCDIKVIFSLEGSPDNPIDTGYYHIEINSNGCLASSVFDREVETVHIYPNPTSDLLFIENFASFVSIEILDLTGKVYYQRMSPIQKQINIASFPRGVYICKLKSNSGEFLVKRILKQ